MQLHALGQLVGLGQAKGVFLYWGTGEYCVWASSMGMRLGLGDCFGCGSSCCGLSSWRSVCLGLNLVASGC